MSDPITSTKQDMDVEQHAMRRHGMLGRGAGMGNALYAIDYDKLPPEARRTIGLIVSDGPFPHPGKDGTPFQNHFRDLPEGRYLEYTVPTPGCGNRGARRMVARKTTGQLFFTACHYERIRVQGGNFAQRQAAQVTATAAVDEAWRNGFYIVTGMSLDFRQTVVAAIKAKS